MDSMMLPTSSSGSIPTLPTATPMQRTFLSWNLMVDFTSVILAERSSEWETGVGNLPAVGTTLLVDSHFLRRQQFLHTLGETGTQQTGNLLDEGVGSDEGIVLASELLDELLVLVELLQVVGAHGVDTAVLGTIDIVLVTEDADAHVGAGNGGKADSAGETCRAPFVNFTIFIVVVSERVGSGEDIRLSRWGS